MQAHDLVLGSVVTDETTYFRCVVVKDAEIGPWTLEDVVSDRRRTIRLSEVVDYRLVEPSANLASKFEGLVGREVKLFMKWGSNIRGIVSSVLATSMVVNGEEVEVPTGFVVDKELYALTEIEIVEVSI